MQDIPYGHCQCGCGQQTEPCPQTIRSIGWLKGEPKRYINGHQSRKAGPKYAVDANGCWLWLGAITQRGYAQVRPHGSKGMRIAHRYYYEQARGPIPEGLQLDHLCHTNDPSCDGGTTCHHRRCVNPDHLEAVTAKQNSERGRVGGRAHRRPRDKPTHCKHGHEFTPANTVVDKAGGWHCRECQKRTMREYYLRRKAKLGAKD